MLLHTLNLSYHYGYVTLPTLKYFTSIGNYSLLNIYTADNAAKNGDLSVLQWLASSERGEHQALCTEKGANEAAKNNHVHILEWLSVQTPPIKPTVLVHNV